MAGRLDDAEEHLRRATTYTATAAVAHYELARTLAASQRFAEADANYRNALQIEPGRHDIQNSYAWMLATCPNSAYRNGTRAVELARSACRATANRNANYLDTLAAAYAETGQFEAAVRNAEAALSLLGPDNTLAPDSQARTERYHNAQPYHQPGSRVGSARLSLPGT